MQHGSTPEGPTILLATLARLFSGIRSVGIMADDKAGTIPPREQA